MNKNKSKQQEVVELDIDKTDFECLNLLEELIDNTYETIFDKIQIISRLEDKAEKLRQKLGIN